MRLFSIVCGLILAGLILAGISYAGICSRCADKGTCTIAENCDSPFTRMLERPCDENGCRVPLFRAIEKERTVINRLRCRVPVEKSVVVKKEKTVTVVPKKRIARAERCGARGPRRFVQRLRHNQPVRKMLRWRPLRGRCCR